ncbi:MAG: glycerol-3-phosphate 1-O-acyltransferase PlsY [Gammaproteobacteria bacterium]|nr:glycerol-3-phosphate 1-O-acyltransferase PlsY [Gammaproteobacteria bacterium]
MTEIILKILISYLLGSLMGALILGKLFGGVDIRNVGSKSAGATNALRARGKAFAAGVFIIDILKGLLAVLLIATLPWFGEAQTTFSTAGLQAICGLAAFFGHLYPAFFGFKGGKGVATLLGVMLGLSPLILMVAFAGWVVILLLTGYVGLASVGSGIVAALTAGLWVPGDFLSPLGLFTLTSAVLLIFTHRSNIRNLLNGTEYRFDVWRKFKNKS